jgi:hypothetical protein
MLRLAEGDEVRGSMPLTELFVPEEETLALLATHPSGPLPSREERKN